MALDLTRVMETEMLINRLELPDDKFPILQYSDESIGWQNLLVLDVAQYHWDLKQGVMYNYTYVRSVPYLILRVMEDDAGSVITAMKQVEAVLYDSIRYKVSKELNPFGLVRFWVLRLDQMEAV